MLPKRRDAHTTARERVLVDGITDLADELRLVDVADLITFIRTEKHPNISDLVNSSLELFFKPDVLQYGWGAEVDLKWDSAPSVMLDMEFRHQAVTVFFRLVLQALRSGVELNYISFEGPSGVPEENTRRLVDAISDARLVQQVSDESRIDAAVMNWAESMPGPDHPEQRP